LLFNVSSLSDYLISKGCGPGIKTALLLGNSALYFTSFFAVSAAKATIVPVSARMTVYEAVRFIKRSNISIAITESAFAKKLADELSQTVQITILTLDWDQNDSLRVQTFLSAKPKEDNQNGDVVLMVYTSGTTGLSKVVMLTDDQLISNMFIYRSVMDFDGHNIVYCSLPLYHIYCICAQVLTHISLGDTFITTTQPFFIKDFLRAVEKHKVTITAFVPYIGTLMSEYPSPDEYDTSSLKYITLSGAKTPRLVYQKLTKTFSHIKFINTYGMSEAGSRISIAAPEPQEFPIESVGKPIPGVRIRITDEEGSVLPAGCVGEVEVKSSGVFKGYFNQPQLTREAIVNGWLKTGDLGKLDKDGNLFLVGRKKQIIVCGGDNIYPTEVEECLLENSLVSETVVVGMPDRRLEEVPCAFVVKKNGSRIGSSDLIRYCQTRLSSFKVPRSIYFIEEIPKLGISKIDYRRLMKIVNDNLRVKP
jgi:acyl-CoA synthetase (AMP-forming)/AMP-acid ligase II